MTQYSEPAFPSSPVIGANGDLLRPVDIGCQGMTLRDYFAAKILPSISIEYANAVRAGECEVDQSWRMELAMDAYKMADAMIAARSNT